jgi:hypothetical protein
MRKYKPAIPEPSPRFALLSIALGVVLIIGLVAFEYGVVGVQPAHKPPRQPIWRKIRRTRRSGPGPLAFLLNVSFAHATACAFRFLRLAEQT